MPFTKINKNTYKSPSGKKFTGKQVKAYYATKGFTKKKISINNKLKGALGQMDTKTNKIQINVKKHKKNGKLDKAELASTIKHELMHVKHPKMTEKEVYKRTAKTKIPLKEQSKLIAKLKHAPKMSNQKMGAIKRKLDIKRGEEVKTGDMIARMNEKKRVALMGLI